ncbi:velvet factor-domain-containing protein [Blakeslea trispora]|nr:velvet factor-domain-containing protein [Blakeslea trispora]
MWNGNLLFQFAQPQQFVNQATQATAPVRQEYDVFYELLSLAANSGRVSDTNAWSMANSTLPQYPNFPNTNTLITGPSQQNKKPYTEVKAPNIVDCSPYNDRIYNLEIIQQPLRARMCGFGDKDRRPISPPPILKLTVTTKSGQIINPDMLDVSFLVVMCDSCIEVATRDNNESSPSKNTLSQIVSFPTIVVDENGTERQTTVQMKNLVGSSVSSATKLYDLDGKLGIFFIFQDVSLRTEGCFRLRFSLIDVASPYSQSVNTASVSRVLKMVQTEPFMVYTAKKFPGVVQSTPLSKCFASQGIKIPIRREKNDVSKKRTLKTDEVSEDEDDI